MGNKNWIEYIGSTNITTLPLRTIFEKHLTKRIQIDVLSVDVEGLDLKVLQSNDWNQFTPKVVIVEAHDFMLESMNEHPLYKFLHKKNFKLVYVMKFSLIFIHNEANLTLNK